MPPRPRASILTTLALATAIAALLIAPGTAWPASAPPPRVRWSWPLRGRVVATFRVTPRAPFAPGQRRGIDLSASPGAAVRAACGGRVTFAGPVPRQGLAVTVRCDDLVATYLRLGRLAVWRGTRVAPGDRLGALGASGRLRLGARRVADRRGYLDPLLLLRDRATSAPPLLGPAPHRRRPHRSPPLQTLPRPARPPALAAAPQPHELPWPAYPAVALIATAFPVGGLIHRRRHRSATLAAAAHEGP